MTAHDEFKCPRCGTPLPTETVRYPVYIDHYSKNDGIRTPEQRTVARYEERREPKDCPRCQGSY